jgi:hypothetical protein
MVGKILSEDGTVNDKAVVSLVETARKEYAGMFKASGPGTGSHNGGKPPNTQIKRETVLGKPRRL